MRYFVFLLLIAINTVSLSAKGKGTPPADLRDSLVRYAKTLINTPYRSGSKGPSGFDCSGYTSYVYGKFGMNLNSSSGSQVSNGQEVDIDNLKKGDLVFFKGHNNKHTRIGHVGIFLSHNDDGSFNFIHSANGGGVRIDNSNSGYYAKRYVTGCTVIADKKLYKFDPVKVKSFAEYDNNVFYASTGKIHKVKKGESLYTIAKQYNVSEEQLKEWNSLNGSKLKPGQKLSIQSEQKSTAKNISHNESKNSPKGEAEQTHTVKKGESFYTIAKKYHISEDELMAANTNYGTKIKPGDKLTIKGSKEGSGNKKEVSEQEEPTTKTVTSHQTHKIKKGETLSEIAEKYHTTTSKLQRLNNLSGTKLKPGANLIVQVTEKEVAVKGEKADTAKKSNKKETVASEEESATKAVTSRKTHKVHKGETLSEIADKYGVSVSQLKRWNGISKNKSKLKPGTYITVQMTEKEAPVKEEKAEVAKKAVKKETVTSEEESTTKTVTSHKSHKVRKGETLSEIADKYGVSVSQLKRWNGISKNKSKLKPGTYITVQMTEKEVPVKEEKTEAVKKPAKKETVTNTEETATKTVTSRKTHKVRKGETLSDIADKYGVSVSQLKRWNGISKNKLKPGKYLTVQMIEKQVPVTQSVKPVAETVAPAKEEPAEKIHVVTKGETLYSIAKSHHISALRLKELNNLSDSQVHEGDSLSLDPSIPAFRTKETTQTVPAAQAPTSTDTASTKVTSEKPLVYNAQQSDKIDTLTTSYKVSKTHIVKEGETLESIAELYQVTPAQIKSWNGLSKRKSKLSEGQKLKIETVKKEYVLVAAKKKRPSTKRKVQTQEKQEEPVVETTAPEKPTETQYIVKKGETLFTVAKKTNLTVDQLKEYNRLTTTEVKENQVLSLIPDSTSNAKKSEAKTSTGNAAISYTVKPGDTLISIAKAYNISVEELKEFNEISSNEVNIGQHLQIPSH